MKSQWAKQIHFNYNFFHILVPVHSSLLQTHRKIINPPKSKTQPLSSSITPNPEKMVQMEFMGMDFSCVFGSLSDGKFPEKDCLLPLISKLLGYAIVAASTTVKLPQVNSLIVQSCFSISFILMSILIVFWIQ